MKNILIPTDFSENSWNALQYAFELFKHIDCTIYLMHVADLKEYPVAHAKIVPSPDPTPKNQKTSSKEQLEQFKEKVVQLYPSMRKHVFMIHEYGQLLDAIKRNIAEKKIDLIAMGTKGASGLKRMIIGSNTGDVITKIRCNTLVIPEGASFEKPERILFPTDYNIFYSDSMLNTIGTLLNLTESRIEILHASKTETSLSKEQKENQKYLSDYLGELFPMRFKFHSVNNKKVVEAIQHFIYDQGGDMVVMVAKNLNFIQQILYDSTVKKMSFQTKNPLFVVHG